MQNTMRAHSTGQISMEGDVDVNKGHMVYSTTLMMVLIFHVNNLVWGAFMKKNEITIFSIPHWNDYKQS